MSLFTVEQLEFIRRLRSTGMKIEQIADAYRQLDQFEGIVASSSSFQPHQSAVQQQQQQMSERPRSRHLEPQPSPQPTSSTDRETPVAPQVHLSQYFTSPVPAKKTKRSTDTNQIKKQISIPKPPPPAIIELESPSPSNESPEPTELRVDDEAPVTFNTNGVFPRTESGRRFVTSTTFLKSLSIEHLKSFNYKSTSSTFLKDLERIDLPPALMSMLLDQTGTTREEVAEFFRSRSVKQGDISNITGLSAASISRALNTGNQDGVTLINSTLVYAAYLDCRLHPDQLAIYMTMRRKIQNKAKQERKNERAKAANKSHDEGLLEIASQAFNVSELIASQADVMVRFVASPQPSDSDSAAEGISSSSLNDTKEFKAATFNSDK